MGVWFAIQVVHLEPIWIKESERGGGVGLLLLRGIRRLLDSCSIKSVFCFSETSIVARFLERLGAKKLKYTTHLWEV